MKASLKAGKKARVKRDQHEASTFPLEALRREFSCRRWLDEQEN